MALLSPSKRICWYYLLELALMAPSSEWRPMYSTCECDLHLASCSDLGSRIFGGVEFKISSECCDWTESMNGIYVPTDAQASLEWRAKYDWYFIQVTRRLVFSHWPFENVIPHFARDIKIFLSLSETHQRRDPRCFPYPQLMAAPHENLFFTLRMMWWVEAYKRTYWIIAMIQILLEPNVFGCGLHPNNRCCHCCRFRSYKMGWRLVE